MKDWGERLGLDDKDLEGVGLLVFRGLGCREHGQSYELFRMHHYLTFTNLCMAEALFLLMKVSAGQFVP